MKRLPLVISLAAVFLVTTGSLTWGNVIVGLAIAAAVVWWCGLGPTELPLSAWLAMPPLLAETIRRLLSGGWSMVLVLFGLRDWKRSGIVEVPFGERTPLGTFVSALVATAEPGSVLVDIDRARRVMILFVIDASDPERTREEMEDFYQRFQKPVVP